MSQMLSKYIASFDYFDKSLDLLSATSGSISTASFSTVVGTQLLARSKLNSIGSKISEVLINNEISHEDFMMIINEERNYRELKESIRMMNSPRSDNEKLI